MCCLLLAHGAALSVPVQRALVLAALGCELLGLVVHWGHLHLQQVLVRGRQVLVRGRQLLVHYAAF